MSKGLPDKNQNFSAWYNELVKKLGTLLVNFHSLKNVGSDIKNIQN